MAELKIDQLSPKSQKSRFAPVILAEANALAKKRPEESLAALEAHARDRVAYGEYSQRLRRESDVDSLTGLQSRRAILRDVQAEMKRAERYQSKMQIIFTDVRDFKWINDHVGHRAGDYALRLIATALRGNVRGSDIIGRLGGDENLLLLPDGDQNAPNFIRGRLHNSLLKENAPYNSMKIDFGAADYNPKKDGILTPEQLIHRADQAMYYAKQNKIDHVVRWSPSMADIVVPEEKQ